MLGVGLALLGGGFTRFGVGLALATACFLFGGIAGRGEVEGGGLGVAVWDGIFLEGGVGGVACGLGGVQVVTNRGGAPEGFED